MSIETDIPAALNALVGNRVYPDVGKQGSATPYITFQQVGGGALNVLEGGAPVKRNGRFQINVWATTRTEASTLARQVEDTLMGLSTLSPSVEGALIATHEPQNNLYGTIQDFSLWY